MKIIKFKNTNKYKYKRKILIKDLVLKIYVGIHNFEMKKKQRVKFNIEVSTDPNLKPNNKDLTSILNYEEIINEIKSLVNKFHHKLLEDLAENIFEILFNKTIVKKAKIRLEKLDIVKNTESVGIEVEKSKY
ncbi:MAG: hypothetical protein CBE33_00170 [Candidatus Pelagibacter sp. TMED273]|nr:MAG: hypothetical protein CBE33_00170 [Candidatus Pelagibacter sp. TMED273]|tara:strand:- start:2825 stop:3220 length:396 start_codon:yes stop_codon:yes gene_type:complete